MNLLRECRLTCSLPNSFYDITIFDCKTCQDKCKTCSNKTSCTSCPTGTLLHLGDCLQQCPDGFASSDAANCVKCTDLNCKKCFPTNPSLCTQCNPGWVIKNGVCVDYCPESRVLVKHESQCRSCMDGCRICTIQDGLTYSIENTVCTKCSESMILGAGKCFSTCPDGYLKTPGENGAFVCLKISCSSLCDICITPTKCRKCHKFDPLNKSIGIF